MKRPQAAVIEARRRAQWLAFGPIVFQVTRCLRDSGMLEALAGAGWGGLSAQQVAANTKQPIAVAKTLLESALGIGLLEEAQAGVYRITTLGVFILTDEMTRVNMNFVHDVCYRGMFYLDEALREGLPIGLRTLSNAPTVYQALEGLPPNVQESWLAFDHFYSDPGFELVLPLVFREGRRPRHILDVGGNTAKWAVRCVRHDPEVRVTIADLPGQLVLARERIAQLGLQERIDCVALDLLDPSQEFPRGHDVIWMSQLLVCFSEEEMIHIAARAARALRQAVDGRSTPGQAPELLVLDHFWDRQQHDLSAFVIQQTSPYFACIANGNSRMYRSSDMIHCLERGGLLITEQLDQLGLGHTLLRCV